MVQPLPDEDVRTVSMAEARAHFSELLDVAAAGETVVITRRGKPVAQLGAPPRVGPPGPRDLSWLFEAAAKMPHSDVDSGDFVRAMRDSDRY